MAVKKLNESTYEVSAVREGEELKHLKEHVLVHFKDAKVDGFRPGHVPAKVIEKKDMVATVEVEGIRRDISLMLLPEANEGDYILMHAGFAIQVIDEEEAKITTELLKEVLGTNEPASERNETDSSILA